MSSGNGSSRSTMLHREQHDVYALGPIPTFMTGDAPSFRSSQEQLVARLLVRVNRVVMAEGVSVPAVCHLQGCGFGAPSEAAPHTFLPGAIRTSEANVVLRISVFTYLPSRIAAIDLYYTFSDLTTGCDGLRLLHRRSNKTHLPTAPRYAQRRVGLILAADVIFTFVENTVHLTSPHSSNFHTTNLPILLKPSLIHSPARTHLL